MYVKIDRRTVVKLFCHGFQARRSIHRGHADSWSGLRDYYAGERSEDLERLIEQLTALLPAAIQCLPTPSTLEAAKRLPGVGLIRHLSAGFIAHWKKQWRFHGMEVLFIARKFAEFLELLKSTSKPEAEVLIQLRMELTACAGFVECRAFGLPELRRAQLMEHYDMMPSRPRLTMVEILGDVVDSGRPARKSA